ncbi:MAG: hypothetical protein AAB922_01905 [Patescibacteria group bacterium]
MSTNESAIYLNNEMDILVEKLAEAISVVLPIIIKREKEKIITKHRKEKPKRYNS